MSLRFRRGEAMALFGDGEIPRQEKEIRRDNMRGVTAVNGIPAFSQFLSAPQSLQ